MNQARVPRRVDALERRPAEQRVDQRGWARVIVAQFEAGARLNPSRVRFAHEALGLPVPAGCRA
jgi:hypothetical protein